MKQVFYPRSIALIGASSNPTKVGGMILGNILSSNYRGDLYLVNPKRKQISGIPCFRNIEQIPAGIDVAIIAIPARAVAPALESLGKLHTKYVIIISAGFSEVGREGKRQEAELLAIAKRYGMRIIGPNCLGLINTDAASLGYNGTFSLPLQSTGNIGFISQSGALVSSILSIGVELGFGFSNVVSIGNAIDISESDIVEYLIADSRTQVIALYLETLHHAKRFIEALRTSNKPVIVLMAGHSPKARKAISSHTGSIAHEMRLMEVLLRESGAIQVKSVSELIDTMRLLSRYPSVSRYYPAIVTNAGGVGVLATDIAESVQLPLAQFQDKTNQELSRLLPFWSKGNNPVDILGDAREDRYQDTVDVLLQEKQVGSIIVVITPQNATPISEIAKALGRLQKQTPHKPIIPVFMGGDVTESARKELSKVQMTCFDTPDRAITALTNLYQWSHNTPNMKLWSHPTVYVKKSTITTIRKQLDTLGTSSVDFETLMLCAQTFNFPMPAHRIVKTLQGLTRAFRQIGTPCVMKVVDAAILHRTDQGAVQVGIRTLEEAKEFWNRHKGHQIIIQTQAPKGIEIFAGVKRDPNLGSFLVLGLGGIYAEILEDFSVATIPITKPNILKALKHTKAYQILDRARGNKYDINALVQVLFDLNLLAVSFPEIAEIDMNPIIVHQQGCTVVDLKIQLVS